MIYLIDAFNLSYKFPEIEILMYRGEHPKAREALLRLIHSFRMSAKRPPEIHLFFDGKKEPGNETKRETRSDMMLYYSHDMSADHLIKEYIKRAPSPGEIMVVTSDKEILQVARRHRCHTVTSDDFGKQVSEMLSPKEDENEIQPGTEENPEVSRDEMLYWRKMFAESKKTNKKK